MHDANAFLTLTFSAEHLPADLSIRKHHLQDFMKRLRKVLSEKHDIIVRFVGVGEYGDQFSRPHYHVILFGCDFSFDWKPAGISQSGEVYFHSPTLTKAWGFGICTVQPVTGASCGYVAGYSMKKMSGKYAVDKYLRWDSTTGEMWTVEPEFALQSRMPGIGKTWFDKYWKDAFPSDFVIVDGRKRPVPAYYLRMLDVLDPKEAFRIRAVRSAKLHEARSIHERSERRLMVHHESGLLAAKRAFPRGEGSA